MGKLIISKLGMIIFVVKCILAFSFTIFWFIPTIRTVHDSDGWLTFWYLVGLIIILTLKIKFKSNPKQWV